MLYSLEDNVLGYIKLIETAAWLIIQTIVRGTLRFRIGISYGKVYIDPQNQIYLGKAIAEADQLQKRQEWSGGALTRQAEAKIPQGIKEADFPSPWHLAQYRVPFKMPKGIVSVVDKDNRPLKIPITTSEFMLAVDWTRFLHTEFHLYWSREREEPQSDEAPADVILKWYNTKEFHKNVCKSCSKQGVTNNKEGRQ